MATKMYEQGIQNAIFNPVQLLLASLFFHFLPSESNLTSPAVSFDDFSSETEH